MRGPCVGGLGFGPGPGGGAVYSLLMPNHTYAANPFTASTLQVNISARDTTL